MTDEKIIRTYEFDGEELGRLVYLEGGQREFRTDFTESEAIDLVGRLPPEVKVHMKSDAYAVYRLLQSFGINPDNYVDNEDVLIYVAGRGYRTLGALNRNDRRVRELVKRRGLERELLQAFQQAGE